MSEITSAEVLLKLEVLQPTFSYKVRGAINAVERHVETNPGVCALVTASAGNHGRALAYAASRPGLKLTVYVPENAPQTKLDAVRALGADIELCRDYDDAERKAKEHAARGDATFISPYSHPDVIAGAGTVGLEILHDRPDVRMIVVPMGGGGLISGIAVAAAGVAPQTSVLGVEAQASHPFTSSRSAGRIVTVDVSNTLADGLAGNLDPDAVTFDLVERLVPKIVTVGESEIRDAMRGILVRERLIGEGAAAVGVAALLARKINPAGGCVAVVLSGANVDSSVLKSLL